MRSLIRFIVCVACMLGLGVATANAEDEFLSPEKAFQVSARLVDPQTIEVSFQIAEGYYLYRERLGFKADGAFLGEPAIPRGKIKFDPNFEKEVETYRQQLIVQIPVKGNEAFTLKVASQGCSDKGLCYAPMESTIKLTSRPMTNDVGSRASDSSLSSSTISQQSEEDGGRIRSSLASGKLSLILPLFFLLGLGLSLTPCVLPMVPILSFIIVGEGPQTSRQRGFILSLAYAMGMAIVYTALGITAGLIGEGLAASLQKPWVLSMFA